MQQFDEVTRPHSVTMSEVEFAQWPDELVALYRGEYRSLVRLSASMLGSTGEAEEVVQEAVVGLRRRWGRLMRRRRTCAGRSSTDLLACCGADLRLTEHGWIRLLRKPRGNWWNCAARYFGCRSANVRPSCSGLSPVWMMNQYVKSRRQHC